jgi:hypothetical protein
MVVKFIPSSRNNKISAYMLFSWNVVGKNTIILIPALNHKSKKKSKYFADYEANFIDIFTLVACAMNINVIIEYHKNTFKYCALDKLWKPFKENDIEILYYPKSSPQTKYKYFNTGRNALGRILKLRKFAGLSYLWNERFGSLTANNNLWKIFIDYGTLTLPRSNLVSYFISSNENGKSGGIRAYSHEKTLSDIIDENNCLKDA